MIKTMHHDPSPDRPPAGSGSPDQQQEPALLLIRPGISLQAPMRPAVTDNRGLSATISRGDKRPKGGCPTRLLPSVCLLLFQLVSSGGHMTSLKCLKCLQSREQQLESLLRTSAWKRPEMRVDQRREVTQTRLLLVSDCPGEKKHQSLQKVVDDTDT
ncbi:unnamed protein product [Pleuronectes platessa]|uniref:Uncharacterized protein n=1 Tax=Pleuronectes platessa TaxID=8262 RepID=A0A9N7UUL0_PLEPL|nr:unnamed protein product [Pleuronectes platessa]